MTTRSDNTATGRYVQGGSTESFSKRIGWWERKVLPKASSDVPFIITAKYNKRPDLLAYEVYGTPRLMWLVLQFNSIVDINEEFVEGKELLLPIKSRVFSELTQRQDRLE